jgi:hypothetical protein
MAEFYVRHSLNYNKTVKFNISLRYFVLKSSYGNHKWVLELGTTQVDSNDDHISPKFIHTTSADNLDEAIETGLATLCSGIDWTPFVDDLEPPYVDEASPNTSDVSIFSNVEVSIKDLLPTSGIDVSGMKVILNNGTTDFDITSELTGVDDYNDYDFVWKPPMRVFSTYS